MALRVSKEFPPEYMWSFLTELQEQSHDESNNAFRLRAENMLTYIHENPAIPEDKKVWFHTDNTGIHILDYHPKARIMKFSNSTSHLMN
jgi:2,3-bisphosphoglycerate-dependent phosphoglycerate mutase